MKKYVREFIEQVYPDNYVKIALGVFDEENYMKDATCLIKDLKAENKRLNEIIKGKWVKGIESLKGSE